MKIEFNLSNRKHSKEIINSNDRLHYHQKAKMTAYLRELARLSVSNIDKCYSPKQPCIVDVIVYSPTKRRLDPPNLYPTIKALIDGLTDKGLWTDDNYRVIKKLSFCYGGLSGTKKYKIVLKIEDFLEGSDK